MWAFVFARSRRVGEGQDRVRNAERSRRGAEVQERSQGSSTLATEGPGVGGSHRSSWVTSYLADLGRAILASDQETTTVEGDMARHLEEHRADGRRDALLR